MPITFYLEHIEIIYYFEFRTYAKEQLLTNYCPVYDFFIGKILDKERDEKGSGLEKRG